VVARRGDGSPAQGMRERARISTSGADHRASAFTVADLPQMQVLCRRVVKVRLASHPRGEHRLTFADATEAFQANTLRDEGWWWRVSVLRPAQWRSERSSMVGRRLAGSARRGLVAGCGSGTSRPHPGIPAGLSTGRRQAPPDGVPGPDPVEGALRWSGGPVAFRAIRYTAAIVPSRSVFTAAGESQGQMAVTWR
jgi:hypothetical protein